MANPEWGTKRNCQSCGTKFYDLLREPIVCPKCHTEFDPEAFLKTRRSRPASTVDKEVAPTVVAGTDPDLEIEDAEVLDDEAAVADAEEEAEDWREAGKASGAWLKNLFLRS